MIEINLLPGGERKKAAAGTSVDVGAMLAGLNSQFANKFLIGSVAAIVIALGVGGWLYYKQENDRKVAEARLEAALADSVRYARVQASRAIAEAKRDTVLRQVNLIRAIDDDRYVWAHVLDEVSRALPAYTWITTLSVGGVQGASTPVAAPAAARPNPLDSGRVKKKPPLQTDIPVEPLAIRLTGRTVDVQAMTRFMADLEDSPFFSGVYNAGATPNSEGAGREYYQFQFTLQYSRPDSNSVRRVPLVATPR